jgi:iron complex transport system substrate-binding protein
VKSSYPRRIACLTEETTETLYLLGELARIVGAAEKGEALIASLRSGLASIAASAARFPTRPRVFFEEWKDPLISGIRWVEELIEIAGGDPIFLELRREQSAKTRIVDPASVIPRDPEVIIGSWCGMKVSKDFIRARPGWDAISAVRHGHIYEVKSTYILQPGPASLTEGVRQLHTILAHVADGNVAPDHAPAERLDSALLGG